MALERLLESTGKLATPALVVDAAAVDRNIARASAYFAGRGTRLRPHFKAHKCTELMRRQLAGGDCAGVTCATAWEAEVVARAGLHDDILVANEVADAAAIASLRRAAQTATVTVGIDSPRHVELLSGTECGVLIEIDVGQRRCGLDPADEDAILALARLVEETPGLRFRGLQGYEGHAVLLPERSERLEHVERAATILKRLRSLLDCEIVSGGGTGTFDLSTEAGALDEIQAGSYVLMDASYDRLGLPFELALACRATVVSRNGTRAVVDAGLKALSAEYGVPRALDASIEEVVGLADEHATLRLAQGSALAVGDAVLLIPAHVDPTVNLHAALHAVEDDGSVHRWPVDATRTAIPAA
jgi:D-serine deaminase-like pyridoxal phosphate-dependent protein